MSMQMEAVASARLTIGIVSIVTHFALVVHSLVMKLLVICHSSLKDQSTLLTSHRILLIVLL
ncbi:putative transmembrane protein 1f [SARS coronavirus ZJ0301]|uniref:Putative transmembrane protein 1f n=2 Tax=Severe acute respiratory syndrome coronavirus TaxID=694009 RepID=Q3S2D9_SARS|nr:putative transmembrane protein 1f [SARS coronavirus ZJ01]ABA02253.1 putative transmembrane protein 1f [SARS coronavirus ZJ0301]